MSEQTITELSGSDVDFDQTIDSDSVTALGRGVAVNGDVDDSAFNTGVNTGIMAGDDVDLDHSTVGNGNVQFSDSSVGAFSEHGSALNVQGENVNMGRGDLVAVDTDGGDAQVVNGNGNHTTGDIDIDAEGADGPQNFVFGDGNHTQALEDNSTNIEDSFNTDNSVEDSGNFSAEGSFNESVQESDTELVSVRDSFNESVEDNDTSSWDWKQSYEDNSSYQDDDSFSLDAHVHEAPVEMWDLEEAPLELEA